MCLGDPKWGVFSCYGGANKNDTLHFYFLQKMLQKCNLKVAQLCSYTCFHCISLAVWWKTAIAGVRRYFDPPYILRGHMTAVHHRWGATSHYLSRWWPRSVSPYGVTLPQRVLNLILWRRCKPEVVHCFNKLQSCAFYLKMIHPKSLLHLEN